MSIRGPMVPRGAAPVALVSGALANKPSNGGNAWTRLGWVLGLRRLGVDAWFVEAIDPGQCRDGSGAVVPLRASENARQFLETTARFGLAGRAALLCRGTGACVGAPAAAVRAAARRAELLWNISGHLDLPELAGPPRVRAYLDDDPGHTQLWIEAGSGARTDGHHVFFTVGANIGRVGCPLPSGGIDWRPVRPPVVLAEWPAQPPVPVGRFTTVASWRGAYAVATHGGRVYGQKAHQFRRFAGLPRVAPGRFEVALDIHPGDAADLALLRGNGWTVVDPVRVAGTPEAFRSYVQGSPAEFSVAQGMYVDGACGWFSDRTAHYLASGRPALVQDTGAGWHCPWGRGLLTFRTPDEAAEGAREIVSDWTLHAAAARALAEEYFDSDRVVSGVLREVGLAPSRPRRPRALAAGAA